MKHTIEMVQILGGHGIFKKSTIERYMRDAELLNVVNAANENMTMKGAALLHAEQNESIASLRR